MKKNDLVSALELLRDQIKINYLKNITEIISLKDLANYIAILSIQFLKRSEILNVDIQI